MLKYNFYQLIRRLTPLLLWSIAVSAFCIEYLIRVAPISMIPELMQSFNASPPDIGAFAAYFLYAYVFMQIPVGILTDKFGVRICLGLSTALCGFSTLLFCTTDSIVIAKTARLLLGFGSAFAWISALKLALAWFKPHLFSIFVGTTQTLGMLGGVLGSALMGYLTQTYGWQTSTQFFGISLLVLAILITSFIKNRPISSLSSSVIPKSFPVKQALPIVFKSKQIWIISLFAGFVYAPTAVFAEVWGSFYLTHAKQVPVNIANNGISIIFLGYAIGGPIAGILANRFGRRPLMIFSSLLCLLLMAGILYLPYLPWQILYLLLFTYGFSNSGIVAAYTAVAELAPSGANGIALGFINGMSVVIGAFCQQWVGELIDWLHTAFKIESINYTPLELKIAMSIILISAGVSFILSFFAKETLPNRKMLSS